MIPITEKKIAARPKQRPMRWMRRVVLFCGVAALGYVGLTLIDAKVFQKRSELTLDRQIQAQEAHDTPLPKPEVKEGDILGRIEIRRLGVSVVILEGTTSQTLLHGVGHIEGTALPGEPGNIGIAGHRDTYFRVLKDIRADDEIQIQTATGITRYKVDWIQITVPNDVGIVSHDAESALTLVSCYPFHYIGAAPERFVVHSHRQ
jgi:sortase A